MENLIINVDTVLCCNICNAVYMHFCRVSSGKLTTGEVFDVSGIYTLLELLNVRTNIDVNVLYVAILYVKLKDCSCL